MSVPCDRPERHQLPVHARTGRPYAAGLAGATYRRPPYGVWMADDPAATEPHQGMIISVLTRRDVVVMDPDRFMAAARRAFQAENPEIAEADIAAHVADVYDAVNALMDRYGSIASEHAEVAGGATPRRHMSGGFGLLPGD